MNPVQHAYQPVSNQSRALLSDMNALRKASQASKTRVAYERRIVKCKSGVECRTGQQGEAASTRTVLDLKTCTEASPLQRGCGSAGAWWYMAQAGSYGGFLLTSIGARQGHRHTGLGSFVAVECGPSFCAREG